MAPDRGRNRASEFADLTRTAAPDFDPEADEVHDGSSDSEASEDTDAQSDGGREHYVDVGKSKLRQPKTTPLGPQYRGSRIDRDAFSNDEEEDDPFARTFEDAGSDEDEHSLDGLGVGGDSSEEDGSDSELANGEVDETSDTDMSDEGATNGVKTRSRMAPSRDDRYELLKSLAKDQRDVASRLAQSNKADAEKGRAVKKQRATFDLLLGTRIKLQRALVGANTIVGLSSDDLEATREDAETAVERAETAAFNLWSSINSLREDITTARTGQKRKRTQFTPATPLEELWSHTQSQEESSLPHRNATLQRWSIKARSATVQPQHSLLNNSNHHQPTIIDALQEHITNPTRLLKRAHTPRSCAPLQLSQNVTSDEKIYDDADFYGLLLKELLEQKSADSAATANLDLSLNFGLQREATTRRNVDTKASKGRKLRYTVHEKLQNFMAPEDRRSWGDRAGEELFGSMFGRRLGLGEDLEGERDVDVAMDGLDGREVKEEGLVLFRG